VGLGYTHGLLDLLTLHIGAVYTQAVFQGGRPLSFGDQPEGSALLSVGSAQSIGGQRLPLARVHLMQELALDGFAWVTVDLKTRAVTDAYMLGLSGSFK
jgi:hypothetical protein